MKQHHFHNGLRLPTAPVQIVCPGATDGFSAYSLKGDTEILST